MRDERCEILAGGQHGCDGDECDRRSVRALRVAGRSAVTVFDAEVEIILLKNVEEQADKAAAALQKVIDLMRKTKDIQEGKETE